MRFQSLILVILGCLVCVVVLYLSKEAFYFDVFGKTSISVPVYDIDRGKKRLHSPGFHGRIPNIVHQTWKPNVSPPLETVRWRRQCVALNPDFSFQLYDDKELYTFVEQKADKYLPLFQSLKGVYMADMARILLIYYYGGFYFDLDFICHRPFHCLLDMASEMSSSSTSGNHTSHDDILVVSQEPTVHANIFREKEEVIIQDFFMGTPRHPFLGWLLDDRLTRFYDDLHHERSPPKGPFSYSIEDDLDMWMKVVGQREPTTTVEKGTIREMERLRSKYGVTTTFKKADIVVLPEDVLHSLVDSTNSRLNVVCHNKEAITQLNSASCSDVRSKLFFRPSERTIAVHMWSHTYLGFSFLRGIYMWARYAHVERTLPPLQTCPIS
jgi:hypothetical protein